MTTTAENPTVPLERAEELAAIEAAIEAAREGSGRLVLVEGPAGIGKTRLLRAGAELAAGAYTVLHARGDLLEGEFPFGLVRQLFEAPLVATRGRERKDLLAGSAGLAETALGPVGSSDPEAAAGNAQAVAHGLYWLAANLSAQAPLALVVDDLHWADAPSLEWLGYLARRLEGLPVLVLAAARRSEGERTALIEGLVAGGEESVLAPRPLSEAAVGHLIADVTETEPDDEFIEACLTASGGNPFMLNELLRAVAQEAIPTSTAGIDRVAELAPDTVARAVVVRLGALPPTAAKLAEAAAVLGQGADLEVAAALAELGPEEAAGAADALAAADLLSPGRKLTFIHPIARTAIEGEMPPSRRRLAHGAAARLLGERNADPERCAAHLLVADPAADPAAVETLRTAARSARERGSARIAMTYLARALEEPPEPAARPQLLAELGEAAGRASDPRAEGWLREAYAAAAPGPASARSALALGRALFFGGSPEEAFEAIDEAEAQLEGPDRLIATRLEAELIAAARLDHQLRPAVADRIDRLERLTEGDPFGRLILLSQRAYEAALAGEPAAKPAAMAAEALAGGELLAELGPEDPSFHAAVNTLALCERLDEAVVQFDQAIVVARGTGSALGFSIASCFRSQAHYRLGNVRRAEADARASVEVALTEGWGLGIPAARAFLIDALIQRGELDAANQVLSDSGLADEIPDLVMFDPLLDARGRLRINSGQREEGIADLLACGERQQRWGAFNPSVIPWRSAAAEAMASVGREDEARELADEELALARRAQAPRALGMALRVAGLVHQDESLLDEAVAVLEQGPSALERARARLTLGALLRRSRRRTEAREILRQALDEADRTGGTALAEAAREELLAAGARPRRARLSGRDSLTASELRVSAEAAAGHSNREIAQSLFVTVKTVETHLGNAYRKLGISSRDELTEALDGG